MGTLQLLPGKRSKGAMRPEVISLNQRHRRLSQLRVCAFQFEMIMKSSPELGQQFIQAHDTLTGKAWRKPRAKVERGKLLVRTLLRTHLTMAIPGEQTIVAKHGHTVSGELDIGFNSPAAGLVSGTKSRQAIFGRTNTGTAMGDELKMASFEIHRFTKKLTPHETTKHATDNLTAQLVAHGTHRRFAHRFEHPLTAAVAQQNLLHRSTNAPALCRFGLPVRR